VSGSTLRVGIDGRAFASPAGGVRRYVRELYGAVMRMAPDVEIVAFGGTPETLPSGIERRRPISFPTNLGWMAVSIPLAARGAALDVYHAPAYTAPLWGVHPLVVTIHDVSYARHPEWNAYRDDPARRLFYRRSALAADRILTDSEFSRREITAAYGIPAGRIAVVPLAAAEIFTPGSFDRLAVPAGVRQPYVLHVGDLHIRRNVATVLAAVLAVRRDDPRMAGLSLVCAGVNRGTAEPLRRTAADAGAPDALVLTGPVADATLLNLYRGAELLVYPSRYEGFGLPLVEAMRCGIPVIGSRCASIPEVVGDAGALLDPLDAGAWALAIVRTIANRSAAAAAAGARGAEFSWARTAEETLAVLRQSARGASR
jgi:glycosyltransferase involved in cell wall biosynthesis